MKIQRTIKYEGELDRSLLTYLFSLPEGEHIKRCIQCGTCSGVCPLSIYMDFTPRKLVALVREGFSQEVLSSFTIWLCSSCYSCTVSCPQQIPITEIMYALKRKAIEEGAYPRRFPVPVLAREFYRMVFKNGRNSEALLVLRLILKTSLLKALSYMPLGLKLLRSGRFSLKKERISRPSGVRKLLKAAREVKP